ncbi:hypothetical protein C499_19367 [Halogeometricum borinquense DSM 11551]|uniref:Uncharacterized protein n=1 Tax=Halogeometricum borinquense (strain ATCC 700274 / DSM 11551 / JCM 10706 / KCTC 4070 / PR3) TaxID=469382 RepID=E4NKS6_HALBP|nr:hypothetical protein Hbor_03670 [Halogeometricum borinquense DSM 11551]ELY23128.1 hypothetical protein C499_19367 [Halogeometricum borinquense DSM 11551]
MSEFDGGNTAPFGDRPTETDSYVESSVVRWGSG